MAELGLFIMKTHRFKFSGSHDWSERKSTHRNDTIIVNLS